MVKCVSKEQRMNIATAVADPFQPAPTYGDDDTALRHAWGTIAEHLRRPLASLLAFMEFAEVYRRFRASEDRDLRQTFLTMIERTRETGDPLGYRGGLLDLSRLVDQATALATPKAENRGIRIGIESPNPFTLVGDQRLLLDAVEALTDRALESAPASCAILLRTELRSRSAAIEIVVPDHGGGSLELGCDPGHRHNWRLWLARLIAVRHGGSLEIQFDLDKDQRIFRLLLPDRLR
jgi:signal transduction histidine kinase